MKKITVKTILTALKGATQFKWKIDNLGLIRAKLRGNSTCFCPLGVYIKVAHNLDIPDDAVQEFCEEHLNIEEDVIYHMLHASDDTFEKDYIDDPELDEDFIWNAELDETNRLRTNLLNIAGVA